MSTPEPSPKARPDESPAAQLRPPGDSGAQDDVEEALWSGGYSPKAMVGSWFLLALISVGLLMLPFFVPAVSFLISLGLIVILWAFGGLVYGSRRLGVGYELTTQRFIHQKGILSRRTDRIEMIDVDDVTVRQGPIERLLGVGTIVLESSDRTHPTLSMIGIAEAGEVAGLIDDTRRKERRRRSLHIEAV